MFAEWAAFAKRRKPILNSVRPVYDRKITDLPKNGADRWWRLASYNLLGLPLQIHIQLNRVVKKSSHSPTILILRNNLKVLVDGSELKVPKNFKEMLNNEHKPTCGATQGALVLKCKWIFSKKLDSDGKLCKLKVRLVVDASTNKLRGEQVEEAEEAEGERGWAWNWEERHRGNKWGSL